MSPPNIPKPENLMREDEVAELLQCSKKTVQSWRVSGKGPEFIRLSKGKRGAIRYERTAVQQWIKDNRRQNTCNNEFCKEKNYE